MISRNCRTCALSAYCTVVGADLVLQRFRRCKTCGDLSYLENTKRHSVRVACYDAVMAWMLRGAVEKIACPVCGEKRAAKIKPSVVEDVIAEYRESA